MTRALIALTLCLGLVACGESRLNPMNWFGGQREERITVVETEGQVRDPRPLVTEVVGLSIEATTSGAIVRATGVTPTQGYWQADLVEAERDGSTLVLEFRAAAPTSPHPQGSARSREIVAAVTLGQLGRPHQREASLP